MNKELVINSNGKNVEIALLEDKNLVELHVDETKNAFKVGDLYLGKVRKLMPQLNAAFVDVGFGKDAFLHYTDLSPAFKTLLEYTADCENLKPNETLKIQNVKKSPDIIKTGKITDVIKGKPDILVQILKEPISTKGPRLSCELSMAGRYVVLTPFHDGIAISKKIKKVSERKRLLEIMQTFKVPNMGVIVRTVAENISVKELQEDFNRMIEQWYAVQNKIKSSKAPALLLGEQDKTTSLLRDFLNDSFSGITVNSKELQLDTKTYLNEVAPDKVNIVKFYDAPKPLFDQFGITKQIKGLFGKTVYLKSGASIIIEHTEACHVIDVNSGNRKSESNQENNALSTNLEAADEIARQLRLRDLGGIIIIDFIDMKESENRKKVLDAMNKAMSTDRARFSILSISKFGLMQITRQRLKPTLTIKTEEVCPSCKGTGKVRAGILITDEIENKIEILSNKGIKNISITVNPLVYAYITKGSFFNPSMLKKWKKKYKEKIDISADQSYAILEYQFVDNTSTEAIQW